MQELCIETRRRRMLWAARRGMLELDLLLSPFVADCYQGLPPTERTTLERLLECQDQDLYNWLVGRMDAPDEQLQRLVETVIDYARRPRESA